MKELDSQELEIIVQKAKNGDKEAFASLYTQYFTPLYKYIYFRVPSKATAEDLTQDVFVKAYMALERYSYSGTSPLAYFYTIARNGIIDYRRKKKTARMDEAELLSQPDETNNLQENAITQERADQLKLQLGTLNEEQREVVTLRFIEGFSTKEIADVLHKTEESVRQLQSRGLRALRKIISHE